MLAPQLFILHASGRFVGKSETKFGSQRNVSSINEVSASRDEHSCSDEWPVKC